MRGKDKNKLIVDPYAAEIVKEIFGMKMDGMSQQAIADELNSLGILSPAEYKKEQGSGYKTVFQTHSKAKWTAMAVMRVLTNEIYVGTLIQGKESTPNYKVKVREKKPREEWIRIENAHEAIINRADFEIISDIIQKDTRVTAGKRAVSIYSGYLVCADCGCSMVRKKAYSGSFEYVYYVCSGNKKNKDTCSSHRISENALNLAVTKTLQLHLKHLADLQESILYIRKTSYNSDKIKMMVLQSEKIKGDIEKYNRLKLECYEDYKNELITQDEYLLFKKELDNRIEDTKKAATELSKKKRMLLDGRYEKESFMEKFLTSKDIELKRSLSKELFEAVQAVNEKKAQEHKDNLEKAKENPKRDNLFKGKIFCGDCGITMGGAVGNYNSMSYYCPNYRENGAMGCVKKHISARKLEKAVLEAVQIHLKIFLEGREEIRSRNGSAEIGKRRMVLESETRDLRQKEAQYQQKLSSTYLDYKDKLLTVQEYFMLKNKYQAALAELEVARKEKELLLNKMQETYGEDLELSHAAEKYFGQMVVTKDMVDALIERIEVFEKGRIHIIFRFEDEYRSLLEKRADMEQEGAN